MLSKLSQSCVSLRAASSHVIHPPTAVKFDSISAAYGYKSKRELLRGWLVFKLCSYTSLVNRLTPLFNSARAVLGRRAFDNIMRSTLYGHFVAGRDRKELQPIAERLHKHGVKLILDYCMESDIANATGKKNNALDDTFFNENMLKAIQNVQTAAAISGTSAITAVKITAFVPPNVLQKLNQTIEQAPPSTTNGTPILDLLSKKSVMTKEESTEVEHLIQRIHRIIQEVKKHQGKIFIDAEQSYFQTAIHKLVLELQETYNQDRLIVYNTYQCYRTTTLGHLREDLLRSKNHGFHIGCKLVRGAYMDQERKRAAEIGGTDPIHPNFTATTECYHRVFTEALEHAKLNGKTHIIVASHNEQTVEFALKTMDSMGVKRDEGLVSFATLFGMCDYLTFPLAAVGYDAFKLAPYGPVDRLLPYLTRRAQENRAIFAKAEKDRRLHYQALKERVQLA